MASRRSETLHGSLPGRGLGAGRVWFVHFSFLCFNGFGRNRHVVIGESGDDLLSFRGLSNLPVLAFGFP